MKIETETQQRMQTNNSLRNSLLNLQAQTTKVQKLKCAGRLAVCWWEDSTAEYSSRRNPHPLPTFKLGAVARKPKSGTKLPPWWHGPCCVPGGGRPLSLPFSAGGRAGACQRTKEKAEWREPQESAFLAARRSEDQEGDRDCGGDSLARLSHEVFALRSHSLGLGHGALPRRRASSALRTGGLAEISAVKVKSVKVLQI